MGASSVEILVDAVGAGDAVTIPFWCGKPRHRRLSGRAIVA
jgi:hypothetical protein